MACPLRSLRRVVPKRAPPKRGPVRHCTPGGRRAAAPCALASAAGPAALSHPGIASKRHVGDVPQRRRGRVARGCEGPVVQKSVRGRPVTASDRALRAARDVDRDRELSRAMTPHRSADQSLAQAATGASRGTSCDGHRVRGEVVLTAVGRLGQGEPAGRWCIPLSFQPPGP